MSVFVLHDQTSDVIFYVKTKGGSVRIISPEARSELLSNERDEYEECQVSLRPLSWGTSCDLQSQSTCVDINVRQRVFDPDLYVRLKLKAIIASWTFMAKNDDEEEQLVPVNEKNIDSLHPVVADYLLREYAQRFELSEEDRKNS